MGFAAFAFFVIFLLIASGGLLLFYREAMLQRISAVVTPRVKQPGLWNAIRRTGFSLGSMVEHLERVLPRSQAEVSVVEQRLIRAGYRNESAVKIFYGAKVLVPLALCLLVLVTGLARYGSFFVYIAALGLGFLAPDFWLGRRISLRQAHIRRGLPDVLDLLVICIEAGLSLDQATARTAEELHLAQPAISDELGIVVLEQRAGQASRRCLEAFCGAHRRRERAQSGFRAGSIGTVWNQRRQDAACSFRHPQNPAPSEGGGASGKDLGQAGLPAGLVYLSLALSGYSGPCGHHHVRIVSEVSHPLRERRIDVDNVTIIRVVAGVLFVIVLFILIQRRRTKVH